MKKEINPPVAIAVVVVLALIAIGILVMKTGGGGSGEGLRPDPNVQGGIHTSGGKTLPTAAGLGGGQQQDKSKSTEAQ